MNRLMIAAVMFGLVLTSANAQDEATQAPEEAATAAPARGPSIFCEQPTFDFGIADSQTMVEHTFVLKNVGDTTLEIGQVRPACGCTVADITPRTVPPGEESRLVARLNLQGRTGLQSKSITINSNDPEKPQFQVTLTGTAQSSIAATPDRFIFGQMLPGQELELTSEMFSASPQSTFNVLRVESSDASVTAAFETLEEGRRYKVTATLKAPVLTGSINTTLRVYTDFAQRPVIDFPVVAHVTGELIFAPAELVLPAQTDGKPLTRYIVIRPGSLSNFEIKQVATPDPNIKVTILPFGAQGYRIQLENITPGDAIDNELIVIETSAQYMDRIKIPVRIAR